MTPAFRDVRQSMFRLHMGAMMSAEALDQMLTEDEIFTLYGEAAANAYADFHAARNRILKMSSEVK